MVVISLLFQKQSSGKISHAKAPLHLHGTSYLVLLWEPRLSSLADLVHWRIWRQKNLLSAVDFPENCTWEKLTPSLTGSPTPRAAHGMCAVGSRLVIFGGRDSVGRKNDIFVLDTDTMEWISKPTSGRQPEPRSFHTCTAVGNRVVVFGGRSLENAHFDDLHIFDTDTNEWLQPSTSGSIPPGRGVHTATLVGDQLVLYGGSSDFDGETMQCQEYHGDVYLIAKEQFLSGMSQGPDPNDVPPVQAQAPLMTGGFANFQECQTIEEEDSSEYEDSSDEQ